MIKTKEELLEIRKTAEEELASYDCRILVCSGTGCIATGSNKIHEIFQEMTPAKSEKGSEFHSYLGKQSWLSLVVFIDWSLEIIPAQCKI